jgi:hypothetical protein
MAEFTEKKNDKTLRILNRLDMMPNESRETKRLLSRFIW